MKKLFSFILLFLMSFGFAFGSNVSQWNDLSGNGENLYQSTSANQPSLSYSSGIGSVVFNGSSTYLSTTSDLAFSRNFFGLGTTIFIVSNSPNDMQQSTILSASPGGTTRLEIYNPFNTHYYFDYGNYSSNELALNTTSYTTVGNHVYTFLGNVAGNTEFMNYDGLNIGSKTISSLPADPSCQMTIGMYYLCNSSGNNNFYTGSIHEIIIYNSALSSSDYQKIEGYLAWRWGLQVNLPINHPYYLIPPSGSNPFKVIGLAPSAWYDANNPLGLYNQIQGGNKYPKVKINIPLGYVQGNLSTTTQYVVQPIIAYNDGQLTHIKAASTTADNGTTVFTLYDNSVAIGTLSFASGATTASAKLTSPVVLNAGDVLNVQCTTAGTATNVSIYAEGTQQSF